MPIDGDRVCVNIQHFVILFIWFVSRVKYRFSFIVRFKIHDSIDHKIGTRSCGSFLSISFSLFEFVSSCEAQCERVVNQSTISSMLICIQINSFQSFNVVVWHGMCQWNHYCFSQFFFVDFSRIFMIHETQQALNPARRWWFQWLETTRKRNH